MKNIFQQASILQLLIDLEEMYQMPHNGGANSPFSGDVSLGNNRLGSILEMVTRLSILNNYRVHSRMISDMTVKKVALTDVLACPQCDLLLEKEEIPRGRRSRCPRCGTVLHKTVHASLQKSIAFSLAGLILFIPAMTLPIMTFSVAGLQGSGNVVDAVIALFEKGFYFVGLTVLFVSILFPLVKLTLLFISSWCIANGRTSRTVIKLFRLYKHLAEWGMVEVYMLGILVSIIKMYSMADITYNTGFFCFTALVLLTVGSSVVVDESFFWRVIEKGQGLKEQDAESTINLDKETTARNVGVIRCEDCGKLSFHTETQKNEVLLCPRCRAKLHSRKPQSISYTWALVLTAMIFYLPANILPMMRVDFMGSPDESTILQGIIYFLSTGDYLVGGIILTASVLVPLFKMVGIMLILLSIHFRWRGWMKHKADMFRFIEFIGRWSFIDVFVVALLSAMVRFGALTTIEADPAAPFFTLVVLSTMFAALTLDPRIMWDASAAPKGGTACLPQ